MKKSPEAFRTIGEVAEELQLPQHVLRFWETRFGALRPMKRGGGRRYYRPEDIELLRGIRHLLYTEGYTIRGVQKLIREHGPRYITQFAEGPYDDITGPARPAPGEEFDVPDGATADLGPVRPEGTPPRQQTATSTPQPSQPTTHSAPRSDNTRLAASPAPSTTERKETAPHAAAESAGRVDPRPTGRNFTADDTATSRSGNGDREPMLAKPERRHEPAIEPSATLRAHPATLKASGSLANSAPEHKLGARDITALRQVRDELRHVLQILTSDRQERG